MDMCEHNCVCVYLYMCMHIIHCIYMYMYICTCIIQNTYCVHVGGVPMFNIPSVVFPVAQYFLEDILQMTRYMYVYMNMSTQLRQ